MLCQKMVECGIYNLKNYFGFDENDIDLSFCNSISKINDTVSSVEFQQSKPYRLALYVRPIERSKSKSVMHHGRIHHSISSNSKKVFSSNLSRKNIKKVNKVMLFDENNISETIAKKPTKTPEKSKLEDSIQFSDLISSRKKVLTELNKKPTTKTRQSKIRKSYEKKYKENITEIISEPHSDEIIKDLDIKKLGCKSKPKKTITKEEKEFEKWAKDINSDFNDVDKFELSITYD